MDSPRHRERVSFAADVELLPLDDEGFVYSAEMESIFGLNSTATRIWRACAEGTPLAEVIARTGDELDLPYEAAEAFVHTAVADWDECGLLDGSDRDPAKPRKRRSSTIPSPDAPALESADPVAETRRYGVLNKSFQIAYETKVQAKHVADVLGHLEIEADTVEPDGLARIDIRHADESEDIYIDGRLFKKCGAPNKLAPRLSWFVFSLAVRDDAFLLHFHSAAVGCKGRALLLPGSSRCGKSTITAALVRQGFDYLSDDSVVLEREGLQLRGLAFAICVKEGSVLALTPQYPELARINSHLRGDGLWVRYLPPERLTLARHTVTWVVFPRYAADAETVIRPLSSAEALRRILNLCASPSRLSRDEAEALIAWARELRCGELTYSTTGSAVEAIEGICTD